MSYSVGTGVPVAIDSQQAAGFSGEPTRAPAANRLLWADCAKGLSIIAVCYMHVVTGVPGGQGSGWHWFNDVMDPIRMPMFFLISGLFAHRVIERTLGDLWYRRLWFLLVPYLVFTPVQAAIRIDMVEDVTWQNLGRAILFGDPGIWFLYALMVFNIAACLLRRVPPLGAVGLSVVPAVCIVAAGLTRYNEITHITAYMPAFFLGLHFRAVFFRLAARATDWRVILGAVAAYVGWEWVMDLLVDHVNPDGWTTAEAGLINLTGMVRILTAVPAGIIVAVWISRIPLISGIFVGIGRHTLPIYVSHHAALYLFNEEFLRRLVESNPERWEFLTGMNVRIFTGFAVCAVAGWIFYRIGRLPVIGWILYPPALPRHRAVA
ncbi:acyltransferase family protein [Corynebacterium variabile]|uniref:acyltransferase family protein n=1 Tax=Corynebacterium variabile TaxID=1727 RepID=UPI002647769B|nr:acyltransferase family protein [Corynebacterium variabile]MDN6478284.1 acyltransferase family protein [Corynebacterium variabile]MDN6676743.1 acyltransferase family protein [Corynebacterium variabile]